MNIVDLMIVPSQSEDEPILVSDANASPLVISSGRLGKYVGKIQAIFDGAINPG